MGLHLSKNEMFFTYYISAVHKPTVRRNLLLSDALSKSMGFKNIQKKSCLPLNYDYEIV